MQVAALLRYLAGHSAAVRAAYVPDATTGTRWFADRAVRVQDGTDREPFVTEAAADAWAAGHPGSRIVVPALADALSDACAGPASAAVRRWFSRGSAVSCRHRRHRVPYDDMCAQQQVLVRAVRGAAEGGADGQAA